MDLANACTHPPTVSPGKDFKQLPLETPFMGTLGILTNTSNGFQKDYTLDCLGTRFCREHLGLASSQFPVPSNKRQKKEGRKNERKDKMREERGWKSKQGQYFLLPEDCTKQLQQSGCLSTLLIWLCITCCCGRYFIASNKFASSEMNKWSTSHRLAPWIFTNPVADTSCPAITPVVESPRSLFFRRLHLSQMD